MPSMLSQSTVVKILLRDRIQILSYIDSFLADPASAEDCYQDVCAAAVSKDIDFEDENHVFRWALRVGRNKAVDLCRRRSREPILLDEDVLVSLEAQWESNHSPSPGFQEDRAEKLRECVSLLTETSQRVVHLRYVDGMKTGRIAELLGRKVATVYQTLTRAHVTLRRCMEGDAAIGDMQETR